MITAQSNHILVTYGTMCKAAAIRFGVVRFVECVQSGYSCHSPPENF